MRRRIVASSDYKYRVAGYDRMSRLVNDNYFYGFNTQIILDYVRSLIDWYDNVEYISIEDLDTGDSYFNSVGCWNTYVESGDFPEDVYAILDI